MAIIPAHVPWFEQIFRIPEFLAEPVMVFGYQEVRIPREYLPGRSSDEPSLRLRRWVTGLRRHLAAVCGTGPPAIRIPDLYAADSLETLLQLRGFQDARSLDLFDPRAEAKYDMNEPVPSGEWEKYGTFVDVGSLEHVFDTRQCLENCLRMVRPGGHYMLHTPVNGYFAHGLHVFNPDALTQALELNGFQVVYKRYTTATGAPLSDPRRGHDVILWLVGRKVRETDEFRIPQQGYWRDYYRTARREERSAIQRRYWAGVG